MGNSSGDRGEREELLVERVRLIRDLYTVLAKIEIVRGVVEQHNKNRVDLARCKEERAKKAKVILGLYMKQVTNTIAKLDGMQEKQLGVEHMKTALAGGGVMEVMDNILQLVGEMPAAVVVQLLGGAYHRPDTSGQEETGVC